MAKQLVIAQITDGACDGRVDDNGFKGTSQRWLGHNNDSNIVICRPVNGRGRTE